MPPANGLPVIDLAGAPALGPETAKVAFVEFSDYECPFCIRHFQQTMPRIVDDLREDRTDSLRLP